MKELICLGIILVVAGCGIAISGDQTADSIVEGWYSPNNTDIQLTQDMDQCNTLCLSA